MAVAAAVALGLGLSACGGGDDEPAASEGGAPDTEAFAEFQACLDEQGVELPGPGGGGPPGGGEPPEDFEPPGDFGQGGPPAGGPPGLDSGAQAAIEECGDLLPEGAGGPGGGFGAPPS